MRAQSTDEQDVTVRLGEEAEGEPREKAEDIQGVVQDGDARHQMNETSGKGNGKGKGKRSAGKGEQEGK